MTQEKAIHVRLPEELLLSVDRAVAAMNVQRASRGDPPMRRSDAVRAALTTWAKRYGPKS